MAGFVPAHRSLTVFYAYKSNNYGGMPRPPLDVLVIPYGCCSASRRVLLGARGSAGVCATLLGVSMGQCAFACVHPGGLLGTCSSGSLNGSTTDGRRAVDDGVDDGVRARASRRADVPQASQPSPGSMKAKPSSRSVWMLLHNGLSHMRCSWPRPHAGQFDEYQRTDQVVAQPDGELGDQIGGRRANQEKVRRLGKRGAGDRSNPCCQRVVKTWRGVSDGKSAGWTNPSARSWPR
jgi:hypothetical protein